MGQRICSVEGCEKPHMARGWCSRHYNTWRRTGDAEAPVREYGRAGCAAPDCAKPHLSKGYCNLHYKRVHSHGEPGPRLRGEVRDGKRVCARCGIDRPVADWGASGWCKPCNREHVSGYRTPVPPTQLTCRLCGADYMGTKKQDATCSPACRAAYKSMRDAEYQKVNWERAREAKRRWVEANRDKVAEKEQRRRARKRGSEVGPVDLELLWTGRCGICQEPLNPALRRPDPMSRSVDHIRPLALGGSHTQDNLQWAHLSCNVKKGARLSA